MKKVILLACSLCFTQFIFSQEGPASVKPASTNPKGSHTFTKKNSATDGDTWKEGTLTFSDAKDQLGLDTTFLAAGTLTVEVTSSKPTEFKFTRDKFQVTTFRDFKLDYAVKKNFQAGHATMALYLYSGKLIVFKKEYSIMFDGSLKPIVTPG